MCFSVDKVWLDLSNLINRVDFIKLANRCEGDVVVKEGNFAVNGKSHLAMASINLSKPVLVEFYSDVPYEVKKLLEEFIEVEK